MIDMNNIEASAMRHLAYPSWNFDIFGWKQSVTPAIVKEMCTLIRKQESELKVAQAAPVEATGEPFIYAIMTPEGKPYFDEHCVDDDPKNLYLGLNHLNDSPDTGYKIVALYAVEAPPASSLLENSRKALAEYVNNSQEHDIGGGDVVVACCESREMAVEALAAIEGMKPNAAPQQHAQAALSNEQIKAVFMKNGFTIKEGQSDLKPYVYAAARAILAARQPAPSVAQPINETDIDALMDIFLAASGANIPVLLSCASILALNARVNGTDKFIDKLAIGPVAAAAQGFDLSKLQLYRRSLDSMVETDVHDVTGQALYFNACDVQQLIAEQIQVDAALIPWGNADFAHSKGYQQGRAAGIEEAAKAIDGLMDFAPTNKGPLPGMTRGGPYVRKDSVTTSIRALTNQGG